MQNISTYTYVANNPIIFKDPDGERITIAIAGGTLTYMEGSWYKNGEKYTSNNEFAVKP